MLASRKQQYFLKTNGFHAQTCGDGENPRIYHSLIRCIKRRNNSAPAAMKFESRLAVAHVIVFSIDSCLTVASNISFAM